MSRPCSATIRPLASTDRIADALEKVDRDFSKLACLLVANPVCSSERRNQAFKKQFAKAASWALILPFVAHSIPRN
jgi:hypothetical protein